jgi:hypothetical protein
MQYRHFADATSPRLNAFQRPAVLTGAARLEAATGGLVKRMVEMEEVLEDMAEAAAMLLRVAEAEVGEGATQMQVEEAIGSVAKAVGYKSGTHLLQNAGVMITTLVRLIMQQPHTLSTTQQTLITTVQRLDEATKDLSNLSLGTCQMEDQPTTTTTTTQTSND